jgi:hypothetical protein
MRARHLHEYTGKRAAVVVLGWGFLQPRRDRWEAGKSGAERRMASN